jgi:predicted CoA-binding protein
MDDINTLRRILKESHVIAVVGSGDGDRPRDFAAKDRQDHGYRVIPVNPKYESILGKVLPPLRDIPSVDIGCLPQDTGCYADSRGRHRHRAKVLWQQLGVRNEEAAKARAAGLKLCSTGA